MSHAVDQPRRHHSFASATRGIAMNIPAPCLVKRTVALFEKIPYSLIAFIARFSIAAVFWKSGQTKVEGLAIDLFDGSFQLGVPHLADSTIPLFQSEYHVPLLSPELAAHLAAFAEHVFPMLILIGFATRFSALRSEEHTSELQSQ